MPQQRFDLPDRQDHRQPLRPPRPHHTPYVSERAFEHGLEEHERVQRLILRTCRHLPVDGEMREKLPDLRFRPTRGGWRFPWNRMKRRTQKR